MWNPDGIKWRPMPEELVVLMKAKSRRNRFLRRWWFWALSSTVLVGCALTRA
jgi:hypothetical protein